MMNFDGPRSRLIRLIVSGAILLGAVIHQGDILASRWAGDAVRRLVSEMEMPTWQRAAQYLAGPRFAEYVAFVRENTPQDARIVLPPRLPQREESNVGLMQFFLFPRDIVNCGVNEVEECVRRIRGPASYILALEDFPPRDLANLTRAYTPFDNEIGIYGPP